jgi:pentatricopeptide repeat protein
MRLCSCILNVEIQSAWKVFEFVPDWVRDVVTYNSIISGYLKTDCLKALQVFGYLLNNGGVKPDGCTLASALTGCARMGLLDIGKKIHSWSVVWELVVDVYVGSSLMDMYIKCGQLADARKVFDRIPQRNVVCWTRVISGYVQSGLYKEAMELFREMQVARIKAESATIASVASACGHLGVLDQGRWVHAYCDKHGLEKDLRVKNALIDMYSKCGQIEKALEIFRGLNYKDVFSWSSMISGLAMNEQSDKSLALFQEMEESGEVKPNEVIFLGVLSACSHGGFVKEGFYLLDKMSQHYNLSPSIEHYGCIVDLLGRANLLDEAEKFIRLLPIKPDAVMWRSLLFACRNNGNLELAELAARRIDELDPQKAGGSVLLSNIYASASRWHDVKRVRNNMISKKDPGCSFIEIDGVVHEFFVADDSHYEMDRIYETVTKITEDMQSFDSCILDYDQYSRYG